MVQLSIRYRSIQAILDETHQDIDHWMKEERVIFVRRFQMERQFITPVRSKTLVRKVSGMKMNPKATKRKSSIKMENG